MHCYNSTTLPFTNGQFFIAMERELTWYLNLQICIIRIILVLYYYRIMLELIFFACVNKKHEPAQLVVCCKIMALNYEAIEM